MNRTPRLANSDDNVSEVFSFKLFLILFSIHIMAIPAFFNFSLFNFYFFLASHVLFGTIGASIGLHRYFSHRSFEFTGTYLKFFVTMMSTLCLQGGPIFWASAHRAHHRFSEKYGDPHDARRGFFWSHVGWMLYVNPNGFNYIVGSRYVPDLRKDKIVIFFEKNNLIINSIFLLLILVTCYFFNRVDLFYWVGPLRIVSVWHSTWLINSYAHGAKLFANGHTGIRNSFLMCLLIGGDGNHDYHHNMPTTVKHAHGRFHFDYGYYVLVLFRFLGLVSFKNKV